MLKELDQSLKKLVGKFKEKVVKRISGIRYK